MSRGRWTGRLLVLAFAATAAVLALPRPATPPPAARQGTTRETPPERAERTPAEEAAIAGAAADGLRPASGDDAADSDVRDELRTLYGDYRPYFVRGDLNGDGRLDFAQAFVRRDGPEPLFDVAAFFGTPGGFTDAVWVERGLALSAGDLSVDRSVLVVSEDVEQDVSRRFRWEPAAGRFVDVDAESGDEGGDWPEPDERLGTKA